MNYVLGFAFSFDNLSVVLITKTHPEWQAGKINGVGGRIEESDASPEDAMVREFEEETGVLLDTWEQFATMHTAPGHTVHCFVGELDVGDQVSSPTEELVMMYPTNKLPPTVLGNIPWLVAMADACLMKTMTGFPLEIREAHESGT